MIPTFAVRLANFISSDPSLFVCKEIVVWVLTLMGFSPPDDKNARLLRTWLFLQGIVVIRNNFASRQRDRSVSIGVLSWRDIVGDPAYESSRDRELRHGSN